MQGSRVWLPDRDEVWIPGQVAAALSGQQDLTLTIVPQASAGQGTPLVVCVRNNEDLPPLMNPDLLLGANDLTTLSYLHEPAGREVLSQQVYISCASFTSCKAEVRVRSLHTTPCGEHIIAEVPVIDTGWVGKGGNPFLADIPPPPPPPLFVATTLQCLVQ